MRQIERGVRIPLAIHENTQDGEAKPNSTGNPVGALITAWLNRGLGSDRHIALRIGWPLWLIPLVLLNQLLAPHAVWVVFLIALSGFYLLGYLWVRIQTPAISLRRQRVGSILVAGDVLQEEFELKNEKALPLLWAEFVDSSSVPDYEVGRIVACEGENLFRWRSEVLCKQRGLFRLGPHALRFQDPLGIFAVTLVNSTEDIVLIYPRVVHLPHLQLPRGNAQGGDRQRRPILGNLPAATISEYQPGDSLRHVHWASTARRGRMMVKDLEIEPSGSIWLVLDLDESSQRGVGPSGTLEHGIVVTASLAAELLSGRDQRAVGLLAYGAENNGAENNGAKNNGAERGGLVQVMPGVGSAHVWPILSALAPVRTGNLPLATLLSSSRDRIGRRSTLTIVTPVPVFEVDEPGAVALHGGGDWVAELVHLKGVGVASSVVLVAVDGQSVEAETVRGLLVRLGIGCSVVTAGEPLSALLTFRRRRRVVRTTPTGGVVSYEVDEEVG